MKFRKNVYIEEIVGCDKRSGATHVAMQDWQPEISTTLVKDTHRDPAFRLSIEKKGGKHGIGETSPLPRGRETTNRHCEPSGEAIQLINKSWILSHPLRMTYVRSTVKTLLTYLPTNLLTSKKAAFTLAEVLITLGIIGVVAAVTMPILITNHQKKVFATKVKQTYSLVSQVLASSVAENGAPNTWNFGEKVENNGTNTLNSPDAVDNLMKTYFLPYFKNVGYGRGDGFYPYIRLANGTTLTFFTDGGTSNGIYTPEQLYIVAGFTGTTSAYSNSKRDYSKKDVFMRVSVSQPYAKLLFFSWGTKDRENLKNSSYYSCNKNNSANLRYNCGALIQVDGWEIKSDYPW